MTTVLYAGDIDPESQTAAVVISRAGDAYAIDYRDGTSFVIDGANVWCTWDSSSTPEDTATYLLGPVLAYVLRLRGTLALHASAVAIGDAALLIAGHARAGKSTTAAAFARAGAQVLTDDVSALTEHLEVQPGYPRLRLWEDSGRALYGELPRLTPNWEKRYADVQVSDEPRRVRAIAILAGRGERAAIRELRGHEAAIALLRHASMTHALDDSMRERELTQITALASSVKVVEVIAPDSLARLDELRQSLAALSSAP